MHQNRRHNRFAVRRGAFIDDAKTSIYQRSSKSSSDTFPPARSDDEIMDIVDEFAEILADW